MKESSLHQDTLEEIKAQWDQKYQGEPLSVLKKSVGGFEVRFNPLRAQYMTSTQHAAIDTDVFCHKRDAIVQNEKVGEVTLPNFTWIIATNTSPIEQYHSLLICAEHQDQFMTLQCLEDLHTFSLEYPEISVGFNGWGAGASQKHLHAQLFFTPVPIAEWERNAETGQVVGYPGICLTSTSPVDAFTQLQKLAHNAIPCNLLLTNGLIFIMPRKNENDDEKVKRGFDSVFGKIPLLSQEAYDQVTIDDVHHILATLTYQFLTLDEETATK